MPARIETIEAFQDILSLRSRYARSIVGNRRASKAAVGNKPELDFRAARRVRERILDEVDK